MAGPQGVGGSTGSGHRLGPHVVGQRVVVRHLLADGRATDVLGVCLSWADDFAVIDRDGDEPVRIAVDTIVTGKPVPPRASVRNRVPPREVEGHVASLWEDVEVVALGQWQLRATTAYDGRRRRGNSLLAMGDPGAPVDAVSERAVEFYAGRDRPALAQVVKESREEAALLAQGWRPLGSGDAHCQLAPAARALRACSTRLSTVSSAPVPLAISGSRADAVVAGGAARGGAVLEGDWLGLHGLRVDPARRREGLATAVLAELLDWGASHGATTAWLHVEEDNGAALALFDVLGFRTHHTNRYLTV